MRPGQHWRFGWHAWVEDDGRRILEKRADVGEMAPVEARLELTAEEWADLRTVLTRGNLPAIGPGLIVQRTWRFAKKRTGDLQIQVASPDRSAMLISTDVPLGEIPRLFAMLEPQPSMTTVGDVFAGAVSPEVPDSAAIDEESP